MDWCGQMSELILVRHGQASFFEDNYDQLSECGREQSFQLGQHWVAEQESFDAVFTGPRVRHQDTAAIVGDCYRKAGLDWPTATIRAELDEHHVDQLVSQQADSLANQSAELTELLEAFALATERQQRQRNFQRLFEAVASRWMQGESFDIESWHEFQARVNRAIDEITASHQGGRRVAVFTSVGPISIAIQRALKCQSDVALNTGWRLWNCSLTNFVYSTGRFTLDRFNALPHLPKQDRTYR